MDFPCSSLARRFQRRTFFLLGEQDGLVLNGFSALGDRFLTEDDVALVPGTAIGAGDYSGFLNDTSVEGTEEDLNGIQKTFDGFLLLCVVKRCTKIKKEKKKPTGCCPNGLFERGISFLEMCTSSWTIGSACPINKEKNVIFHVSRSVDTYLPAYFLANQYQTKQCCFGQQPVNTNGRFV